MSNQASTMEQERRPMKIINRTGGAGSAVYGLGFIGALAYYIQHATTFGIGLLGVLKAMVWPAMLIYKVLDMLKM